MTSLSVFRGWFVIFVVLVLSACAGPSPAPMQDQRAAYAAALSDSAVASPAKVVPLLALPGATTSPWCRGLQTSVCLVKRMHCPAICVLAQTACG